MGAFTGAMAVRTKVRDSSIESRPLSSKQLQVQEIAAWKANGLVGSKFPGEVLEKTCLARMWAVWTKVWIENFRVRVKKVSATDALFGCVV